MIKSQLSMSADKCQKASKKEILASEYSSEQVLSVHTSSFYILLPFAIKVIDLTPPNPGLHDYARKKRAKFRGR